jgi:hypothetical protein
MVTTGRNLSRAAQDHESASWRATIRRLLFHLGGYVHDLYALDRRDPHTLYTSGDAWIYARIIRTS